jgi:hypothetical protein
MALRNIVYIKYIEYGICIYVWIADDQGSNVIVGSAWLVFLLIHLYLCNALFAYALLLYVYLHTLEMAVFILEILTINLQWD